MLPRWIRGLVDPPHTHARARSIKRADLTLASDIMTQVQSQFADEACVDVIRVSQSGSVIVGEFMSVYKGHSGYTIGEGDLLHFELTDCRRMLIARWIDRIYQRGSVIVD